MICEIVRQYHDLFGTTPVQEKRKEWRRGRRMREEHDGPCADCTEKEPERDGYLVDPCRASLSASRLAHKLCMIQRLTNQIPRWQFLFTT